MVDNKMLESIVNSALADVKKSHTNVGDADSSQTFSFLGGSGVFEVSPDGKGRILSINDSFRETLEAKGYDFEGFAADIFSLVESKFRKCLRDAIEEALDSGDEQHVMIRVDPNKAHHQSLWVHLRIKAFVVSGHKMFFASIENKKSFDGSMMQIEEYSSTILRAIDALDIGVILSDPYTGEILYTNSGLKRLFILDENVSIQSFDDLPVEGFLQLLKQSLSEGEISSKEVELPGGAHKLLQVWAKQYSSEQDVNIVVIRTEKVCPSAGLNNPDVNIVEPDAFGDSTFELSMKQIGAVVTSFDVATQKVTATDGYERFAFSEIDSKALPAVYMDALGGAVHPDDAAKFKGMLTDLAQCPTTVSTRFRARLTTGEYEWVTEYATSFFDSDGEISRVISTIVSVDKDERINRSYKERAEMDTLTCVYNRSTSESRMLDVIKTGNLDTCYFVLLDIDDFKDINDMYGHPAGDEVLKSLGQLLRHYTRSTDVVGRMGGDEFTILYCDMPSKEIVVKKMDELREEFRWLRMKYDTRKLGSVSFGVVGPASSFNGFRELYKAADHAMYTEKRKRKN